MAKDYDVDVLGSLPLDIAIRERADSGTPTVVADPDGALARRYRDIARGVALAIAERARDMTSSSRRSLFRMPKPLRGGPARCFGAARRGIMATFPGPLTRPAWPPCYNGRQPA
jgi:hypothetical protein